MNSKLKFFDMDQLNAELIECRLCPRLSAWREEVSRTRRKAFNFETYWGKPVPGFGDLKARLLIIGLAPGAHGSNRTGRMFTGDASGDFLFPALYRAGFATQPTALRRDDGLQLKDVFISAVCRCVPPGNKPTPTEIRQCLPWLKQEIQLLPRLEGIIALGRIAYDGVVALGKQQKTSLPRNGFAHGALHLAANGHPWVLCSYHPSRQNTQTGRLTPAMFDEIWQTARHLMNESPTAQED